MKDLQMKDLQMKDLKKKFDVANILVINKQPQKAEIIYNEIINNSTEEYLVYGSHYNLGMIYYRQFQVEFKLDEAMKHFNIIPPTQEKYGYMGLSMMVECFILKKNYIDAYECLLKLLELEPQNTNKTLAHKRIIKLFLKTDDWDRLSKHKPLDEDYIKLIYTTIIETNAYNFRIKYSSVKNIMTELNVIVDFSNIVPLILNHIDDLCPTTGENKYYDDIINWITPHGIMILSNFDNIIDYNIIDEDNITRYFHEQADITNLNGETMLMYAIKHNYPIIVKQMMKNGANPYFKNKLGENSFDIVMSYGNIESRDEMIYYMLKYYNRSNAPTFHDKICDLLKRPDIPDIIKNKYT